MTPLNKRSCTFWIMVLTIIGFLCTLLLDLLSVYSWAPIRRPDTYFLLSGEWYNILQHPWQPISYLFLHNSFYHLLLNLLLIYLFTPLFEKRLGKKNLFVSYLIAGAIAGLFYPLLFSLYEIFFTRPILHLPLAGASGGIVAIVVATGMISPQHPIYLWKKKVPLIFFSIGVALLSFLFVGTYNLGGVSVHIGGIVVGICIGIYYRYQLKKRSLRIADEEKSAILIEKIKQSGFSSLTKEERIFLMNLCRKEEKCNEN